MNLHHIGLVVKNIEGSEKFYLELFGCKVLEKRFNPEINAKIAFIGRDEIEYELIQYMGAAQPPYPLNHYAHKATDLSEICRKLKMMKVPMEISAPKTVRDGRARILMCRGPDGERIEFHQEIRLEE